MCLNLWAIRGRRQRPSQREPWIPNNNTVAIAEPGRSFGGIGGGFSTIVMSLLLPKGTVGGGANTIRFRFNQTDGFVSGYRVLAWNLLTVDDKKILSPDYFAEDAPEAWTRPLPDAASIQAGRELWQRANRASHGFAAREISLTRPGLLEG
jgi:hypothetical protein